MSLLERETVEYSSSPDELMLKELERRDGIYSFIFHELETTKEGSSYVIDNTIGNKTNGFNQNQFIIYKVNEMVTEANMKLPVGIKSEDFKPISTPTSTPTRITTSTVITTASCSTSSIDSKSGDNLMYKSSPLEFWKTWCPPFSATSLNTPSSCRFFDEPKLFNYVATGSFGVRLATPRFSHNSVPLVRNRRHALKETPEYQNFNSRYMGHAPDLRSLFPHDPDVHAPFAEISCVSNAVEVGAVKRS